MALSATLFDIPAVTQIHLIDGGFHGGLGTTGQQADRKQGSQRPLLNFWFLHLTYQVSHPWVIMTGRATSKP